MAASQPALPHAGSILMVAIDGHRLTQEEKHFLQASQVAGIILFKRNIRNKEQLQDLIQEIQDLRSSEEPMLIGIDQEGGRVSRLDFVPNLGPCLHLFPGSGPESLERLYQYGKDLGSALRELGIHINFAPVADILTEPSNHAIGDRVFGVTAPEVVSRCGAFLDGLQWSGTQGCLKHFPGQGDAKGDTHETSITIPLSREILETRELVPFRELMHKAPMIMISHCIYPALSEKPATLSAEVQHSLLRQQMGFEGLIVSDDMNMGALPQDREGLRTSLASAIQAGTDLLLICKSTELSQEACESLQSMIQEDQSFASLVAAKERRIRSMRRLFLKGE